MNAEPDPEAEPEDEKPDLEWDLPLIHLTSTPIRDRPGYVPPWEEVSHIELNIMDVGIAHPMSVEISTREHLRAWWHDLLRAHGRFYCYGVFLMLAADKEARKYATEYAGELHQASGKNCAILGLGRVPEQSGEVFDPSAWRQAVDQQVEEGNSLPIAEIFRLPLTSFPAVILFRDIRSSEHVLISLKGLSAEEIAARMRGVYQAVSQAAAEKQDPLRAVGALRRGEAYRVKRRAIISGTRRVAGQTLAAAIEAVIKAVVK